MSVDISAQLIQATVQVEQQLPDGSHIIGTGFLVSDPTADGKPRTVLVTANHVLNRMTGLEAHIGYRVQTKDGWRYDPRPIVIRTYKSELWTHNPSRDVAAIVVKAPAEFAKSAIPLDWLAGGDTFAKYDIGPGDEMMVLGYPQGLSADSAGFPILRSGRVASPIDAPSNASPTFLLDFRVFPGNSGGPVFISQVDRHRPGSEEAENVQFVAGMLTQQVELNDERLEIGIVTDAAFIRDTIALLDKPKSHAAPASPDEPAIPDAPVTVTDAAANVGSAVGD